MFGNRYKLDDMSKEAKEERNSKAKSLKIAIILSLLILLFQPIYQTYSHWGNISPELGLFLSLLMALWSWCIYKVFKYDFRREEDID